MSLRQCLNVNECYRVGVRRRQTRTLLDGYLTVAEPEGSKKDCKNKQYTYSLQAFLGSYRAGAVPVKQCSSLPTPINGQLPLLWFEEVLDGGEVAF